MSGWLKLLNNYAISSSAMEREKDKNKVIIQGYKISPTLFNTIIYKSTRKLNKTLKSRTGDPNVLLLADDGLLLADKK